MDAMTRLHAAPHCFSHAPRRVRQRRRNATWASNAASSACRTSASRPLQRADQGRHRRRQLPVLPSGRTSAWCRCRTAPESLASDIVKPQKVVPTAVGSSTSPAGGRRGQRRRLGNKFLAHIREVDAICHVVRCFRKPRRDPRGEQGRPDRRHLRPSTPSWRWPTWSRWTRRSPRYERVAKGGDKDAKAGSRLQKLRVGAGPGQVSALGRAGRGREGRGARAVPADPQAGDVRRQRARGRLRGQSSPRRGARRASAEGAEVVPVSAAIEEELSQLDDADRDAFLKDLGSTSRA